MILEHLSKNIDKYKILNSDTFFTLKNHFIIIFIKAQYTYRK